MPVINQIIQTISPIFRQIFLLWIMTGISFPALSQDFNHYERLQVSGSIPEDFILSPSEKYQQSLTQISQSDKGSQKAEAQFYQESHYYINQLLLSGKVLFNDPLSEYVSKVGRHLLSGKPDLQQKMRFYVVKSPSVNAFATNNGIVLVNMGLLAKLENEAQLAFILSHEISHYIYQHPLEIYLKAKELMGGGEGFMRKIPPEDILLESNNYSKEKELEADIYGLNLFLESDYSLEAVNSAFDLLKNAHLPFSDDSFSVDFFESGSLKFPKDYTLDKSEIIDEQYFPHEISGVVHPDPKARKDSIAQIIKGLTPRSQKSTWIISQSEFLKIRKIARFENSYLYLYHKKYELAIFNSYLLLQEVPESFFLKKIITQSLYGLTKYSNAGQFWDVHLSYDLTPGSIQSLLYLIEKLQAEELNIVSIIYNWHLHQQFPEDIELRLMLEDQIQELGRNYIGDIAFFADSLPQKIDSLREDFSYIQYAFADLLKDEIFREKLTIQLSIGRVSAEAEFNKKRKPRRKKKRKEANLGLEKIVFVDPLYQRIDDRKKSALQFIESEANSKSFTNLLSLHANTLGLESNMLSTKQLNQNDVVSFQELSLLNEWIYEKICCENVNMISINHENVQKLKAKYGTQYFVWTGIVSLTRPRTGKALVISAGVIFFPILPYSFYYLLSPNHDTFFYTVVYDIESGENVMLYPKLTKMKDRSDVLNSMVYDLIYQIKNP